MALSRTEPLAVNRRQERNACPQGDRGLAGPKTTARVLDRGEERDVGVGMLAQRAAALVTRCNNDPVGGTYRAARNLAGRLAKCLFRGGFLDRYELCLVAGKRSEVGAIMHVTTRILALGVAGAAAAAGCAGVPGLRWR